MASDVRFSTTLTNDFLDQVDIRIGSGGFLRFYTGTKPATADAALSGNTQLAELPLSSVSFGVASGRTITAAAITTDTTADATGTATWATLVTSAGVRHVDLTVGEAADSADITVDNKAFQAGADIAVTSLTLSIAL
ncbi:MAG: hypothetical protein H0W74_13420 [Sphingosinicella sp.]|nr:hypothetical protein [Sphingosinicella sp.]